MVVLMVVPKDQQVQIQFLVRSLPQVVEVVAQRVTEVLHKDQVVMVVQVEEVHHKQQEQVAQVIHLL